MKILIIITILTCSILPPAIAGSYSIDMPLLCGFYEYGTEKGPQVIDLNTSFSSVTNISIRIAGSHLAGYWEGGYCDGPFGATIMIQNWGPRTELYATGMFETNILLSNSSGEYLSANNGKLVFSIRNPIMYCLDGGSMVTDPLFSLNNVVLTVQGVPDFKIKDIADDGTCIWSQTPDGVTAQVESATSIYGIWSTCAVTSLSRTGAVVTLPSIGRYFLRAVINDE